MGVDKTWTPLFGPPFLGPILGPILDPLLDPFLDPSFFFGENKKDNRLKLDKVRMLHTTTSFALKIPFLQYSVERRFPLDATHFKDYLFF